MAKKKEVSDPKVGMNRATSPHSLGAEEFSFQLNGNSYDEGGEKFNLTDEHSNILATKYKSGFKFVGGKNHVVRDVTYIFLHNPTTEVSEIGRIKNVTNFNVTPDTEVNSDCTGCNESINEEATPLEDQIQVAHQNYETLLEDSCNLCLGFDLDHPIIDIIIKEENIGTTMWWTSTPGKKEFRYIELDKIDQYKLTGDDNCGATPVDTCIDCDKLRVFKLYSEIKRKDYQRVLGGNLPKGGYEILGAYSDQLGNEFTSYVQLTPVIPIFDEANIIHEQEDNNAITNFAIKLELDELDTNFDYYKVAVRYYTSNGVFTSFEEGIHGTSDRIIVLSDVNGPSINNTALTLKKPFVESVDGITASNDILILNGIREREPINLQPIVSLAGLAVEWMSFRAKEDLYSNADSYLYIGYNRDENVALSIDFGMEDGYRTDSAVFIPRPATADERSEFITGKDYESITDVVGACDGNLRNKKWQFYNTATELGACPAGEGVPTVSQEETLITYTKSNALQAPAGTIVLTLDDNEDYVDLTQFIEDNQNTCGNPNSPITDICPFIDKTNPGFVLNVPESQCPPNEFTRVAGEDTIEVASVENEVTTFDDKDPEDYSMITPPQFCRIHVVNNETGDPELDFDFAYKFNIDDNPFDPICVKKRNPNVYNTRCASSTELVKVRASNINTSNTGSFYHLNKGALTVAELQTSYVSTDTDGTRFTNFVHEGALWFKTPIGGRNKFFLELSEETSCEEEDCTPEGNEVRVNIFSSCGSTTPIYSKIIDLNNHQFIEIDVENSTVDGTAVDPSSFTSNNIFVAVDVPIVPSQGYGPTAEYDENDENPYSEPLIDLFRTAPLCGCFNIVDREEEFISVTVTYDSISIVKVDKYTADCVFEIPVLGDCEPIPYKFGQLGYYESTEEYADNSELFDSSSLIINKDRITSTSLLSKLDVYKSSENASQIILSDEANFRCKKIRHFKMPDNKVSPFIGVQNVASNSDSIISPLGFKIDGESIRNLLDVAVDNGLLTQEQRNSIVDYKIYRSDSTLDRSVVGSGIVYNTKSYEAEGEKIEYFNYPFNSLGSDKYFPANTDEEFNKIQVASPEFDYFKPSLPSEISIQGFMFGKSSSRVVPVDNHSRMVILGDKAKKLASSLALLEVAAEAVISISQVAAAGAEAYRVQVGLANAVNPAGIIIATAATIAVGLLETLSAVAYKVGRYRLQWEKSFEDLGAPYNFGYYTASGSKYNYLKTLQVDGDRLRGASVRKYLKPAMLSVSDTTTGEVIRLNNIDREEAPFFSLGDYPIENLDPQYTGYDNSDASPSFSSQILSSEIGCHKGKSPEVLRNIASPYVAFKNYIPNQYGTIDSIKWVDTNYCIDINDSGDCTGILGGDTFISRHSKKRKARIFETDLLGSADNTPFPYKFNSNYGEPRFFIDYKVNSEFEAGGKLFPSIFYDVKFDCNENSSGFYVEPPGKFYLYSISFSNFLCETRINTNFRNARKEPWNQFYPQNTDYEVITQPNTVALTRREDYFYNKAYLQTNVQNTTFGLPEYYSSENEAKKAYNVNSGIYSLPDANENSITEPWLMYRPNDKFTLESRYGNLIGMKGAESGQIVMYFEDATQIQNAKNPFTDGQTDYTSELGNGGMFAKRAITLRSTDIGYGGSQSKNVLSCEFGHFHADMKRGQIFNVTAAGEGSKIDEVSRYSNGRPNGMDVWFKEHLPLKFAKKFPEYTAADNPYNGMGIHWGYDSKYRRVILTKKDYLPKLSVTNCGSKLYNSNVEDYSDVIASRSAEGYNFEGIEDCQLKFSKEGLNSTTDIYATFDTTSMTVTDGEAASDALKTWYDNYKINNPSFTGNLYIIPFGVETYLSLPSIIQAGIQAPTAGVWDSITELPPNYRTVDWVPPTDLLLLTFIDEANSQYHGNDVSAGFSSNGIVQPTSSYFSTYNGMKNSVQSYNSFRGVLYPIVRDELGQGGALVLQALAAMKGRTLTQPEIDATNTGVDVSILLTENPYSGAPIVGTNPQEFLEPLETFGWAGQYDKTSPASDVFTSQQFQDDLNELVNGEGEGDSVVYNDLDEVSIDDETFFKEVSWTITYKPETGSWESYMSYTPNYYINHTDYFQSGLNTDDDTFGLWSHLLSNKSYRVFYGQKFPYIFEYPVKNEYISKRLEAFSWNAQLRRYHNDYDFAAIEANPFTAVTIYNNYENSGRLIPVLNNGTLSQLSKYPITNREDNSQEVLLSYDNYRYNLDYFYNRVKSNRNNQPVWLWDENQIGKTLNPKAVSFFGKSTLERLKGNSFIVRLERDGNTNYDLDFRWSEQTTNPIR